MAWMSSTTSSTNSDAESLDLAEEPDSNVTVFAEYKASVFIWQYIPPVLLVAGTFGNVATIVVFQRLKRGYSAQPLILTALAVADLCVLYSGLIPDMSYHVFDFDLRGINDVSCKLLLWLLDFSAGVSTWLLVALTTQRAISVTWPHRVSLLCSYRKTRITIIAIVVFEAVWESHQLYGLEAHDLDVHVDGACSAASGNYEEFWESIWPWLEMVINSSVPSLTLVICNVALVRSLRRSTRYIANCSNSSSTGASSRKKTTSSTTVTILVISVTFLLLAFPIDAVIIAWSMLDDKIQTDARLEAKMELAWVLCNMSWYTNSAVNFPLYCLSGSRFRQEFVKCFKCNGKQVTHLNASQIELSRRCSRSADLRQQVPNHTDTCV